jgi:hypothetical protein
MNAFADFEKTTNMLVWQQKHTSTSNMICGQSGCYSNCRTDYKTDIPLDLKGFFGRQCDRCNHNLSHHHRSNSKWEQVLDKQVSVNQDMKKRWEAAKDEKEKAAALLAASNKVLNDLNQVVSRATTQLAQLAERYARLSLSGSFSAKVGSAVRLLEQHYRHLERKGISEDHLQKVKASLDYMKKKLEFLTTAKEKAQMDSVVVRKVTG